MIIMKQLLFGIERGQMIKKKVTIVLICSLLLFTNTQTKDIKIDNVTSNVMTATIPEKTVTIGENKRKINIIATFYTGSPDENGGYANITASGKILSRGMCASNNFDFGTKIEVEGLEEIGITNLEVQDTGNPKYIKKIDENTYRLDVYVPDKKTAKKLGVKQIKGYVIKE